MKRLGTCVYIILALTFLQACDNFANSEINSNKKEHVHKGYYIYGHEVNTFQPCGQTRVLWVSGSNEVLEKMQQHYARYTSQPYEEVFVELTGDLAGKATDGFAMDYDGRFWVVNMLNMNKKTKADCNE